jgi:hypothetical protein
MLDHRLLATLSLASAYVFADSADEVYRESVILLVDSLYAEDTEAVKCRLLYRLLL